MYEINKPKKLNKNQDLKRLYAQEKIDGYRALFYSGGDLFQVVGRNGTDYADRLNHLVCAGHDFVIDGELFAGDFSTTQKALSGNKDSSPGVSFYAFDLLYIGGVDVTDRPFNVRQSMLADLIASLDNPSIILVDTVKSNVIDYYNSIIANGGEGVVLKDKGGRYEDTWYKLKASYDSSAIVLSCKYGTGKHDGYIKSLSVGVYDSGGNIISIGSVPLVREEDFTHMQADIIGKVIDFRYLRLTEGNKIFQPVFDRVRLDYLHKDCTLDRLLKKKPNTWA